ncbi:FMN-binding glutamate synthase family protein [Sulfobacillus harzensis]|uniref:FMN-binding glutamate synthase family protein n=1 Tax=Sulfobacillus harzensis TaxID=2729629 RepID=A0A7Y0Q188_9FIRM|nr:FMN-binding glutamate synthase family protein [Sulfobacillus harzensis]NMP21197.1 FMN-binding glutamate synthase family protein [Sulfobacillus harzensis]
MLTFAIVSPFVALGLALLGILWFGRRLGRHVESSLGMKPKSTLWEMFFTMRTHGLADLLMTMQRAESGQPAEHPMGSKPAVDWLNAIGFDPATFVPKLRSQNAPVDLRVTLGAQRSRPLHLAMPILIAPMGYGIALSAETKVALAQAATLAGIAILSGEGPYLPEERAFSERWILQESRGGWAHQPAVRNLADMIELQWGQASEAGKGLTKDRADLPPRVIQAVHGEAVIEAAPYHSIEEWVDEVRRQRSDCPLGVKIPASQHLESDLALLCALDIDVITLDGAGAGSAGSPAVISDYFGISTALAAYRAHRWLMQAGFRDRVSLVVSGGVHGAVDAARLIALGADAVAVGSELLFAALHEQVAEHWPMTPPTQMAFARSKRNHAPSLDVGQASEHITHWLDATRAELATILRTQGLSSLTELRATCPLIARTPLAARVFSLPFDGDGPTPPLVAHKVGELVASYAQLNRILTTISEEWAYASRRSWP